MKNFLDKTRWCRRSIQTIALLCLIGFFTFPSHAVLTGVKPELVIQTGHINKITSASIGPHGKYLATGSVDNSVKLWNVESGAEIRTFRGHKSWITSVAILPDGKRLITGSYDQTAILWDLVTGDKVRIFRGHKDKITAIAVGRKGRYLITGSRDKTAILWDINSGKEIRVFDRHPDWVTSVAISSDGKYIITGGADRKAYVWDTKTGSMQSLFWKMSSRVSSVAISPDLRYIVTGNADGIARIWSFGGAKRTKMKTLEGHKQNISSIVISPDSKFVITGSHDKTVVLWDITTGKKLSTFKGHKAAVTSVAISSDGKRLITASMDATARLWDLQQMDFGSIISGRNPPKNVQKARVFTGHTKGVRDIATSPDGRHLLTANGDGTVRVWDLVRGAEIRALKGNTSKLNSLVVTPNGRYVVTGGDDHIARLWDIFTGEELRTFEGHNRPVWSVAVNPDGKSFISGSMDFSARLWDITSGKEIRSFEAKAGGPVWAVDISPDGKTLATGHRDGKARLWDINTGALSSEFEGHLEEINTITFTPDGQNLITGSADQTIRLWDTVTGEVIRVFEGHKGYVSSVFVSADNKHLISGSWDKTVRIWDLSTGKAINVLEGHENIVESIVVSPNGNFIFTGSSDGTMRIWDITGGAEICRLISIDPGWVAVAPKGQFDGSPSGLKSIRWAIGLKSYPLQSFSEGFFEPGLLASIYAGMPIEPSKLQNLSEGFALPPQIKIVSPNNNVTSKSENIEVIVFSADQGGGIDEIRLFHNGKVINIKTRGIEVEFSKKSKRQMKKFQVRLVDGKNYFKAVGFSLDRIESNTDEITIVFEGKKKKPNLHLLTVGIDKYKNPSLNLNYARADALSLRKTIQASSKELFDKIEIHEFYDEDATKSNIISTLKGFHALPPQDVVIIFLAGHGESLESDWYFIPPEVIHPEREAELKKNAISATEIEEQVRLIGARKVLLLMDACKSGSALASFRGFEERRTFSQLARATGIHIVAATGHSQFAAEVKELKHGIFTYTLLEAFKGKADRGPEDGITTVREILSYVENVLPQYSKKHRSVVQYPVIDSRGMDFPVAVVH